MCKKNLVVFILVSVSILVQCGTIKENATKSTEQESLRRGRELGSYMGLVSCAVRYDVSCFVHAAGDYLDLKRTDLLAEADAEALQSGRSDNAVEKPSTLANMIMELTKLFENGIGRLFDTKDTDTEDDEDVEETDSESQNSTDVSEAARAVTSSKKKKKKPLKSLIRLIKLALIALIIVLKLAVLLKVLQTAMQFKFLLISLGSFAIQAAKLWMSIRNKKDHGHEEIVYKNPYGAGDEYPSPGGAYGGEYNAARSAHEIAYSVQRALNM